MAGPLNDQSNEVITDTIDIQTCVQKDKRVMVGNTGVHYHSNETRSVACRMVEPVHVIASYSLAHLLSMRLLA